MKVKPPFIGYPSPGLAVWHLFARCGDMIEHVAFLVMDANRWGEPRGSVAVERNQIPYNEADIRRWSEFECEKAKTEVE